MSKTDSPAHSNSSERESLFLLTKLKLERFRKHKVQYDEQYTQILQQITDEQINPAKKLKILSGGIKQLFPVQAHERYLTNIDALLTLTSTNTSTSDELLNHFSNQFIKVIEGGKKRANYNYLLGSIMSQWFSQSEKRLLSIEETSKVLSEDSLKTRERLQEIIFDPLTLDLDRWKNFLQNTLFPCSETNLELKDAYKNMREQTTEYGHQLLLEKITPDEIRQAMRSLISNKSLSEYQKQSMEKLLIDENAVAEFASCLTLMIADLDQWSWPSQGIRGIFRRDLNGRYRCFYEEDFLTAIFLEHIGLKWSYHFKEILEGLFSCLVDETRSDYDRQSIQRTRLNRQRDEFWMASLPDSSDPTVPYMREESPENEMDASLKEKLFHLVNVEIQLHKTLHPQTPFTVVCTDLEWFGPSISHDIVRIFLEECGMPRLWLDFFDRFLKQPVFYKPDEPIRQRQRGVPISHSMSFLFSELLLFGMDWYIHRSTGVFNYRLHDDFIFFDSDSSKVEKTWTLMNEYAQMTGLKFHPKKSASIQILPEHAAQTTQLSSLPQNEFRWGFLTLKPNGRFVIDQESIKPYLDEMKTTLDHSTTIFEWINIYNKYVTFFMRNFGKCATVLGTFHVEQIIDTFQFIHRYVFEQTNGDVLVMLTKRLRDQFPESVTESIPEGCFYWPLKQGGLGLKNIYLDLYGLKTKLSSLTDRTFTTLPEKDVQEYDALLKEYDKAKKNYRSFSPSSDFLFISDYAKDHEKFIPFEEFISRRETHLYYWNDVYQNMSKVTTSVSPTETSQLREHLNIFKKISENISMVDQKGRYQDDVLSSYMKWLVFYYGGQIESSFGQVDFVDKESLPIRLINMLQQEEIDWDKAPENRQEE